MCTTFQAESIGPKEDVASKEIRRAIADLGCGQRSNLAPSRFYRYSKHGSYKSRSTFKP